MPYCTVCLHSPVPTSILHMPNACLLTLTATTGGQVDSRQQFITLSCIAFGLNNVCTLRMHTCNADTLAAVYSFSMNAGRPMPARNPANCCTLSPAKPHECQNGAVSADGILKLLLQECYLTFSVRQRHRQLRLNKCLEAILQRLQCMNVSDTHCSFEIESPCSCDHSAANHSQKSVQ